MRAKIPNKTALRAGTKKTVENKPEAVSFSVRLTPEYAWIKEALKKIERENELKSVNSFVIEVLEAACEANGHSAPRRR